MYDNMIEWKKGDMGNKKRVLVFKGSSAYNVLRRAADEIAVGIERCGYDVEVIDVEKIEDDGKDSAFLDILFSASQKGDIAFAFFMQAIGFELECNDGKYLYEHLDYPVVGWIFDEVMLHYTRILGCRSDNSYLFTIDGGNEAFVKTMGIECNSIMTMLHGGFCEKNGNFEKEIDVFIPCSKGKEPKWIKEPSEWEVILAEKALKKWSEDYSQIYRDVLRKALADYGLDYDEDNIMGTYNVSFYVKDTIYYITRKNLIKALADSGLNIHILGGCSDSYPDNVTVHGPMQIDDVVSMINRSKVMINPLANSFEKGAHERIFTAFLNKAICFSMSDNFLKELYPDSIEYFDLGNLHEFVERVRYAVNNYDSYEEKLESIYKNAFENDTWEKRGMQIVEMLEQKEVI